MTLTLTDLLATSSGALVGLALGLLGGGGSIMAVPLLIYIVGIKSPHVAIGTSAVAVSVSAFSNLIAHWVAGRVKWRCALVFAASGVIGALAGSSVAKALDGQKLMALFGIIMVTVGATMLRRRVSAGDPSVRLTRATAADLLPWLIAIGFCVGLLSGFFGVGGGFLIVPGLMLATGMPLSFAIGASLVAVAAFGAATAVSYALSGFVDWWLAGLYVVGGAFGGLAGISFGRLLAGNRHALGRVFASLVMVVGVYVIGRGILNLS